MMKSESLSIQTLIQNYFLQRLMQQRKVHIRQFVLIKIHFDCIYGTWKIFMEYL